MLLLEHVLVLVLGPGLGLGPFLASLGILCAGLAVLCILGEVCVLLLGFFCSRFLRPLVEALLRICRLRSRLAAFLCRPLD